jgi:uncharacterized GH25 family protein
MFDQSRFRGSVVSLALFVGLMHASQAAAHDFWIHPEAFQAKPFSVVLLKLQTGHGQERQRSPIPQRRITRFEAIYPTGDVINLVNAEGPEGWRLKLPIPGAYVVALETDNGARSYLPASRFNDYARAEGLAPALMERARTGRMDADALERYCRRAKTIVQVGVWDEKQQSQVTKPLGLSLEIVPELNPYAEPRSAIFPVRVIYEGRPLGGALVKLVDMQEGAEPAEIQLTDNTGRASFRMPASGTWLLNVVWTKPLPVSDEADFETVFSSLTFGFTETMRVNTFSHASPSSFMVRTSAAGSGTRHTARVKGSCNSS